MILGIDIGGTTINLGLVEGAKVVKKVCVPSFPQNASQDETLTYLGYRIAEILVPGVERIGIGVPSVTDPVAGVVYNAANIPSWDVVPLKAVLEKRFQIPVSVNNDANCYALGAYTMRQGSSQALVCVTLGTGTGVGIVIDGKLFNGTHCGAGEIGALPYEGLDYESFCSKKFFTHNEISPREAAQAAEEGDPHALALFDEFGRHLGEFLTVVMYAYDPDCIVLGGGVAHTFKYFQEAMRQTLLQRYPYAPSLQSLCIEANPNEDAALVGAAAL